MAFVSDTLKSICVHQGCTLSTLADKAGIHRSALSRIQNGHDEMSANLLAKLLEVKISDDDAAALAEDWTIDHWPQRAKDLLIIRRRQSYADESFVINDSTPTASKTANELDRTITDLHVKARGNPALARALRNLNRTLDGNVDVID